MSNSLQKIFETQIKFTKKIFAEKYGLDYKKLDKKNIKKWNKEFILSASKEIYEMLDEISWKEHRFLAKDDNYDNFIEEGIDAFKFLLNLFIINGYNYEDFENKFFDKSEVVNIRYEQEKQLEKIRNSGRKFAVIDIDGVLNNYPLNFIEYFQKKGFDYKSISEFKDSDRQTYKKIKHEFRIKGEERKAEFNNDSRRFFEFIREIGLDIILLTARPYHEIIRLFSDTVFWLKKHSIDYDFIFFSKDKEDFLIENFNQDQIAFVVDDQIDNCNKLSKFFKTYCLLNNHLYKSSVGINEFVYQVKTLKEIEQNETYHDLLL